MSIDHLCIEHARQIDAAFDAALSTFSGDDGAALAAEEDERRAAREAVARTPFARDVLAGLSLPQKALSPMWLYDRRGSELFDDITYVDEYYPTRCEIAILEAHAADIARIAGPGSVVVELGSGSSRKTPLLLRALQTPLAYVPIDISGEFLRESADLLQRRFAGLPVLPVCADFSRLDALPACLPQGPRLGFFPGSTIGNFTPQQAQALLRRIGRLLGPGALLAVGADGTQDPSVLIPAYDDRWGVTAAFDLNLLARINRELGADFDLAHFRHEARWDARRLRVEMHLVSRRPQSVSILGRRLRFANGESIHTESSYKLGTERFGALARRAGWQTLGTYTGAASQFGLHLLRYDGARREQRDQNVISA